MAEGCCLSPVVGVRGALGVWRSGCRSWRLSLADAGCAAWELAAGQGPAVSRPNLAEQCFFCLRARARGAGNLGDPNCCGLAPGDVFTKSLHRLVGLVRFFVLLQVSNSAMWSSRRVQGYNVLFPNLHFSFPTFWTALTRTVRSNEFGNDCGSLLGIAYLCGLGLRV